MDISSIDDLSEGPSSPNSGSTALALVEKLSYRAQLIQRALAQIPHTSEGLAVGYYRADLIPSTQPDTAQEESECLRNAYQDLSFEYGYPTLHDGRAYWHKLEFEPGFAYGAFEIYLEQIDDGPRELSRVSDNQELHALASRAQGLPEGQLLPKSQFMWMIQEYSILYFWRPRSKAHDLYQEAAHRHRRLRRQTSLENKHYELSEKWLAELQDKVMSTPEFWDTMSAKTAVELLGKLVGIGRISVGLPMSGPLSQKEQPQDLTFEMLLRAIGQRTNQGNTHEGNVIHSQNKGILDAVLQDKGASDSMQEVVIRVTQRLHGQLPNSGVSTEGNRFKGRGRNLEQISNEDLVAYDVSGAPGANLDSDGNIETATVIDVTPTPVEKVTP